MIGQLHWTLVLTLRHPSTATSLSSVGTENHILFHQLTLDVEKNDKLNTILYVDKTFIKTIALRGIWYINGLFSPEQTPPAMNFLFPPWSHASQGGDRVLIKL